MSQLLSFNDLIQHFTNKYESSTDEAEKTALGKVISTLWERNSVVYAHVEIKRLQQDVDERIAKLQKYSAIYEEFLLNSFPPVEQA